MLHSSAIGKSYRARLMVCRICSLQIFLLKQPCKLLLYEPIENGVTVRRIDEQQLRSQGIGNWQVDI